MARPAEPEAVDTAAMVVSVGCTDYGGLVLAAGERQLGMRKRS